jgi:hypothetical protein
MHFESNASNGELGAFLAAHRGSLSQLIADGHVHPPPPPPTPHLADDVADARDERDGGHGSAGAYKAVSFPRRRDVHLTYGCR